MRRTEETLTPVSPSTSELVSYRNPDGLILSTGNLYFTFHDAATASVWRAAQSALPGQEILLYSEPGARFGDIVFAQVDGVFWGYFFSTNGGATATIKRVSLTGGASTVLTTLTDVDVANSHRNLVTDGVNLYWQDVHSVRKMDPRGRRHSARPGQPEHTYCRPRFAERQPRLRLGDRHSLRTGGRRHDPSVGSHDRHRIRAGHGAPHRPRLCLLG